MQDPSSYNWDLHAASKHPRATLPYLFVLVTQAVYIEVVTSLATEAFLAALRHFIIRRGRLRVIHSNIRTNVQGVQSAPGGTTHFNVQPRWWESRITWQQKATTGSSSHYMDNTSEAYGKQQLTWNTTCDKSRCTRLPPMKNWHLVSWDRSLSQLPTPLCSS